MAWAARTAGVWEQARRLDAAYRLGNRAEVVLIYAVLEQAHHAARTAAQQADAALASAAEALNQGTMGGRYRPPPP